MEPESNPLDLLKQRRAINRVEAAMRKTEETPKPGGYRYLGRNADTGQGLIVGNDGSVIPGDIITSGHIKPGQAVRVAQAGGMVQLDQKPRVRKVVPPVVKEKKVPQVKIIFSAYSELEGSTIFYVGGDRKEPKELFRLPNDVSYFGNITPNITITGSGLNSYYYQYSATTLNTAPLGLGSSEIYDSRYEAKAIVPPITFYPGLYYGIFVLSGSLIEQNEFTRQLLEIDDPYLPTYMGAGVFAASATPHIGFSSGVDGSSSFTHVVHVVDRNEVTSFSMSAGSANRTYLSPGTSWSGAVAYSSEIKGIDFYRVSGSEGGTTDLPGGVPANSYSCNFDVVNMFQYSPEVCLMQRCTSRLPNLGVANAFTRKLFSLKEGVEREISEEGVTLLRSNWVAPRMAPIRKDLIWMHDKDSPLTIQPDQEFIDLKSLNLLTNEIGAKRVKMYPLKYTNNLIHSFDYYTP